MLETAPINLSNKQLAMEILKHWGLENRNSKFSHWDLMLEAAIRLISLEKEELTLLMREIHVALAEEKAPIRTLKRRIY